MTRLEIYSDVVCPWCFLGAANLMRALTEREQPHAFAIRWRPFQLDPSIPAEGLDREAYMTAKFGDTGRFAATHARLEAMGAAVGLDFHFDRIKRSPNTLDAHRVIHWAEPEGLQTRVAMALFSRYFERGEDVSDPAVLVAAAIEAGMDGAAVERLLAGDADRQGTETAVAEAQGKGITGVPTFIVGGRYAISGAQPVESWTRVIDEIEKAAAH